MREKGKRRIGEKRRFKVQLWPTGGGIGETEEGGGDFFLILPATRMRRREIRIPGISVFKPSNFIFVSNVAWRVLLVSFSKKGSFCLSFPSCLPSFVSNEQIANCSSRPPPPPPQRSSKCRREYTIKTKKNGWEKVGREEFKTTTRTQGQRC